MRKPITSSSSSSKIKTELPLIYTELLNQTKGDRLLWLTCSAYARGIHYAVVNEDNNILVSPLLPDGRKRCKYNKIGTWEKHMAARIVSAKPDFEAIPRDTTMESLNASQCGTAFLQESMDRKAWKLKRYKLAKYCLEFGNAIAYTRDIEDRTREIAIPLLDDDGAPVLQDDGQPQVVLTFPEELDTEVLPPHNVLCDRGGQELQDKFEVILAFKRSLNYYEMQYGEEGKKVKADKFGQTSDLFNMDMLSHNKTDRHEYEGAIEVIYMQKPNRLSPEGLFCVYAGGELLVRESWPYEKMTEYPLTHFRYGPAEEGEFWTTSPIKDQIPPQKDLNEVISIVMENISNMGHGKFLVPTGSGFDSISDLSGEILPYTPGLKPEQMTLAPLPHYEVNQISVIDKMLEDIQMFHSVSKGAGTPNVRSAVGLDRLSDEDTTPLSIVDDYFSEGYQQVGSIMLKIAAEKFEVPRMIRFVGEGRRRTISDFNKQMLEGAGEVKVRMVDSYLRNKGATQQLILTLAQAGMFVDKQGRPDTMRIQKMLQFALPEMLFDKEDTQRQIQYEENGLLIAGTKVPAAPWENHWLHLEVLEEMMNGAEWKTLVKTNQEVYNVTEDHRQQHIGAIKQTLAPPQGGGQSTGQAGAQPQPAK